MRYVYLSDDPAALMREPDYWDKLRRLDGKPVKPEQLEAVRLAESREEIEIKPLA